MKKLVVILIFIAIAFTSNTQAQTNDKIDDASSNAVVPQTYIGLGTGINCRYGLLGASLNQRLHKQLTLDLGLGLGTWGTKLTGGVLWMPETKNGWSPGVSFSYSSGANDLEMEMEVINIEEDVKEEVDITMDLEPAYTVNLLARRHWGFRNGNQFFLELGYAVPVNSKPWKVKTDNVALTKESKVLLGAMQPGGLLIALGFNFGLKQ